MTIASHAHSPWRSLAVLIAMLALTAAVVVLFFFDPSTAGFFPVCAFHELTGWQCPGCGGLRAVHQLCHGHIAAAWDLNPFLVGLLPVALWLGVREAARIFTGREWPGLVTRPICAWLLTAALVLFGILRNVPFHAGH
jgi:hypothetical protein